VEAELVVGGTALILLEDQSAGADGMNRPRER
jgi:hypothetical protein